MVRLTDRPDMTLAVDPRVGISRSAAETDDRVLFLPIIK